jgi:hypothetical protein
MPERIDAVRLVEVVGGSSLAKDQELAFAADRLRRENGRTGRSWALPILRN